MNAIELDLFSGASFLRWKGALNDKAALQISHRQGTSKGFQTNEAREMRFLCCHGGRSILSEKRFSWTDCWRPLGADVTVCESVGREIQTHQDQRRLAYIY
jgi:hypothetical protein